MKKVYLVFLLIATAFSTVFSQVPNAFNYQAVVRNSSGEIVANKTVSFRISLLKNSETGTVVYSETHSLSTNEFGLVNFKIGKGAKLSGDFSPADWGEVIFAKIEFDPAGGSAFSELATTKLSSVPFAFVAQSVVNDKVDDADADPANEIQTLSLNGTLLELSNGGGSVTLPTSGGSGGDNWGTQTVQTDATLTGNGTGTHPLSVVADGDGDNTNELQTLSLSGNDLTLSDGGGTVALPASPWTESSKEVAYRGDKTVYIGDGSGSALKTKSASRISPPKFEIETGDKQAINIYTESSLFSAVNIWNEEGTAARFASNSSKPVAIFDNNDTGLAAEFKNSIKIADGSQGAGKVLTSDADGNASWQIPAAGGSSLWTESGDNVYRSSGKVGIGTASPSYLMDIQGSSATLQLKGSSMNAVLYLDRKGSTNHAYLLHRTNGANQFYVGLLGDNNYRINSGSSSTFKGLKVETDGDVDMSNDLNVDGSVFINENLEVADDLDAAGMSFSAGEITKSTTGTSNNLLPFAYGTITKTGGKIGCTSNVGTITKVSNGQITVSISGLGSDYTVVITPIGGIAYVTGAVYRRTDDKFNGLIWDTKNDKYYDGGFSFIVYKP